TVLGSAISSQDITLEMHGADPPVIWAVANSTVRRIQDDGSETTVTPEQFASGGHTVVYAPKTSSVYVVANQFVYRRGVSDTTWRSRKSRFNVNNGVGFTVATPDRAFLVTSQGFASFSDEVVQ